MGLKGGVLGGHNLRLVGASGSLSLTFGNGGQMLPIVTLNQYYGIPGGYSLGRGYVGPVKPGGMGSIPARGLTTVTGAISATGVLAGSASGVATVAGSGFTLHFRSGLATGSATVTGAISAIGHLKADLFIGSRPTADDIAQATRTLIRPLLDQLNDNVKLASLIIPATEDLP